MPARRSLADAARAHDGLGSPLALTNEAGSVLERYIYTEFGTPTATNVPTGAAGPASFYQNPILFTGREWEPEAGVYYYRARYYNPTTGRFLSRDPLGIAPDLNLYRYVGNNPTNWTDPDGRNPVAIGIGVGAGVGALLGLYNAYNAASIAGKPFGLREAAAAIGVGAVAGAGAAAGVTAAVISGGSTVVIGAASAGWGAFFGGLGSASYQSLTGTPWMDLNLTGIGAAAGSGALSGFYGGAFLRPALAGGGGPLITAIAGRMGNPIPFFMGPMGTLVAMQFPLKLGDLLRRFMEPGLPGDPKKEKMVPWGNSDIPYLDRA